MTMIASFDLESNTLIRHVPAPTPVDAWRQAVQAEAASMQANCPDLHERIADATHLVLDNQVELGLDGHASVASRSTAGLRYDVNGTCPCKDAQHHTLYCAHRIAVCLVKRTTKSLGCPVVVADPPPPLRDAVTADNHVEADVPVIDGQNTDIGILVTADNHVEADVPVPPHASPAAIPAQYVVTLHGKSFVQYTGLLAMAHARGLVSLKAHFISVTDTLALAEADATFADGTTYSESADSTPQNVGATVKAHFPRIALTRAKARCLRDALNIGMCSVEELSE